MEEITIKDVLKKAIEMEENGKIFYEYAASIVKKDNVFKVLQVLAEDEVRHKHIFENMLNSVAGESFGEENSTFMKQINEYISHKSVFDRKKFEKEIETAEGILKIIDFAIDREMDSIFYYMTLMAAVKEEQKYLVEKIIDEERKHFIKLNEAKKLIGK